MTTIKTNDRELVAVEVPAKSHNHYIANNGDVRAYFEDEGLKTFIPAKDIGGNIKIVNLLEDMSEQQAAEYVRALPAFKVSSITGLTNLLQSHGLNTSAPILLIEKVK